ncbi:MAG: SurA N-terminal domain-containing protein, partial [Planctomycetales bacterium]
MLRFPGIPAPRPVPSRATVSGGGPFAGRVEHMASNRFQDSHSPGMTQVSDDADEEESWSPRITGVSPLPPRQADPNSAPPREFPVISRPYPQPYPQPYPTTPQFNEPSREPLREASRHGFDDQRPTVPRPEEFAPAQPQVPHFVEPAAPPVESLEPRQTGPEAMSGAGIRAQVGTEIILEAEVLPIAERRFAQAQGQQGPKPTMKQAVQHALISVIQRKLIYQDARNTIPEENFSGVLEQLDASFEGRIVSMMEQRGINSRAEFLDVLARDGVTLERQRQIFREQSLASQWRSTKTQIKHLVTRAQLLDYYQASLAEYEIKAHVRWEEVMVRFDRFPSKQAAYQAIAR